MKIKIQMTIENDSGETKMEDIVTINRGELSIETVGLTLKEAKDVTANIQELMTRHQFMEYIAKKRFCSCCGKIRCVKGYHSLTFRTVYGKLKIKSPRLNYCSCEGEARKSFSPLANLLTERISPECLYLQTKMASLMSYGVTAKLLEEVLPIQVNKSSLVNNCHKIASRLENELDEERYSYIEGCPRDWGNLPKPNDKLTVGIDGGFIHAREDDNRKAGWFEVIVGKSLQNNGPSKRFGFVTTYDTKPKRRLHNLLQKQGLQLNQSITFLSDGGDNVRDLQLFLSPEAEYILDWFHVTMRITVMKQIGKGLSEKVKTEICEQLSRIKWYLWHGNVYMALTTIESLLFDLDDANAENLYNKLDEFNEYIRANSPYIPNYADRYHYGEYISTGFVESTVNELVTRRMVKKQQMRWTKKGAHFLLQNRVKTLNNELWDQFCQWYPEMAVAANNEIGLNEAA